MCVRMCTCGEVCVSVRNNTCLCMRMHVSCVCCLHSVGCLYMYVPVNIVSLNFVGRFQQYGNRSGGLLSSCVYRD